MEGATKVHAIQLYKLTKICSLERKKEKERKNERTDVMDDVIMEREYK